MNPVKGEVYPGVVFDAVLIARNEVKFIVPDTSGYRAGEVKCGSKSRFL